MTPTGRRKLLSSLFVGFCAGAVLLALVPLALDPVLRHQPGRAAR